MKKMKILLGVLLTITIISGCRPSNPDDSQITGTEIKADISASKVVEILKENNIKIIHEALWNPTDFYGVSIDFDFASIFQFEDESTGKVITFSNNEQLAETQNQINIAGTDIFLTNETAGVLIILDGTIAGETLEEIETILNNL